MGVTMPVDIKKMSQETGIAEEVILARLGIRANITSYKSAYLAYKRAIARDSESTQNRKVESELLRKYTTTFWRALFSYKVAPWNSEDKRFFFDFALEQVLIPEEAQKILDHIPPKSPAEVSKATCKISEFYTY